MRLCFSKSIFFLILSGIPSECQTACIQNVGPDLDPNCLQRLSADDTVFNFSATPGLDPWNLCPGVG